MKIVDAAGRPFALAGELGRGGEGAVFAVPGDPPRVAKIYHAAPPAGKAAKLEAMARLAAPELLEVAAWPGELLYRGGRLAGFVMPRLSDFRAIQELYNPARRLRTFPRAGWRMQARAARNLAAAVDEVHKSGCVVGDINENNVWVSAHALVRLIDCDSFQVPAGGEVYRCEVGVAHYTPPELQGVSLRTVTRTPNHDAFGLAVLIYQLLFVGRYPYAGRYTGRGDPSFEELIREFRFSQGPLAATWDMAPPPFTPTFADIPIGLSELYRRAFERGGESGSRPRPSEWIDALAPLEGQIVDCDKDAGHQYWGGAGGCVWCRLAEGHGPEYYFGVAGNVADFAADDAKARDVLRRLRATEPALTEFDPARFVSAEPPRPEPLTARLRRQARLRSAVHTVAAVAVAGLILATALGWRQVGRAFVAMTVVTAPFSLALVGRNYSPSSEWSAEKRRRRQRYDDAGRAVLDIGRRWRSEIGRHTAALNRHRRAVEKALDECRALDKAYRKEIDRLTRTAVSSGLARHLRLHMVSDAAIPKVGEGRKQLLAGHGVSTAADVDEDRVRKIKGFGPSLTAAVVAWRKSVEKAYKFDRDAAASPAERRLVVNKYRSREKQLHAEIDRELAKLEDIAGPVVAAMGRLTDKARSASAALWQADADLALMAKLGRPF